MTSARPGEVRGIGLAIGVEPEPPRRVDEGRWAFVEVTDPWDAGNLIRAQFLRTGVAA